MRMDYYKAKYRPILMCILNIVISIILAKYMGVAGVIIGTIISKLVTVIWLDPYIIYHYGFKENVSKFYKQYLIYLICYLTINFVIYTLYKYIVINNIFMFAIYGILTFTIIALIICLLFHKTKEFKYFYNYFMTKLNKILKKKRLS